MKKVNRKINMEVFKKKKTVENQLFDIFFEHLFCNFENKQKSKLFIQNSNNEGVFLNQVTKSVGHLRSDLQTITLS
jgi:hypothetical protein